VLEKFSQQMDLRREIVNALDQNIILNVPSKAGQPIYLYCIRKRARNTFFYSCVAAASRPRSVSTLQFAFQTASS
jgi:hypothetical protein